MPMQVSATEPDWSRERKLSALQWAPSKSLLASIRSWQRHQAKGGPLHWPLAKLALVRHRFWSVITGADIPVNCSIGGGLIMPHPNGIVIHPAAVIGPNCLIFQQVTIGAGSLDGLPRIAGHVDLGAGAKVLGGVCIDAHARIGANAVVLADVPEGGVAVGIPAKVIKVLP
jgi:serine O-acetyltransferase